MDRFTLAVQHAQSGRFAEAEAECRAVLAHAPRHPGACHMLGVIALQSGRNDEAADHLQRAVELDANSAEARYNFGIAKARLGATEEAERCYRQALHLKPAYPQARINLASLLIRRGGFDEAFDLIMPALALPEARTVYAGLAHALPDVAAGHPAVLSQAFTEPWGRPDDLAPAVIQTVLRDPRLVQVATDFTVISAMPLLCRLLETTTVCDVELERALTQARRGLLSAAIAGATAAVGALTAGCALARQSFINEYVFALQPGEVETAQELSRSVAEALANGKPVSPLWLAAVGAYIPLHTIESTGSLSGGDWNEAVRALIRQQIEQPTDESRRRAAIPRLTAINDQVSKSVRLQYEENPYPRWLLADPGARRQTLDDEMTTLHPAAAYRRTGKATSDILIAGCGTGRHAVETARKHPGSRVLAVDLSLGSLAYAARQAAGLAAVEFAQADILELGGIGRDFDLIEALGVLHHLDDPAAGWRVLRSLLRPDGVMRIGLYSAIARRQINAARTFVAAKRYAATAQDMRQARQAIVALKDDDPARSIVRSLDFYGMSSCRDLLFHVQESQHSLPEIKDMLAALRLDFLGFVSQPAAVGRYRQRFPDDRAMTDLDQWHIFETENPDTFLGMYQFDVQAAK